jgi:thymidylate synthase
VFQNTIEKCDYDKTKNTLITAAEFLDIIRHSEEFKYLEKQEKKVYTKNKVIDFFKNNFFDDFKKKIDITTPKKTSISNCITGYRRIKCEDSDMEDE